LLTLEQNSLSFELPFIFSIEDGGKEGSLAQYFKVPETYGKVEVNLCSLFASVPD
jgi:hypothetical protein